MPPTIIVTDYDWPDLEIERSVVDGTNVELRHIDANGPEDIIANASEADALYVQYSEITADVFEALNNLKIVGRTGIGVDNVDIDSANEYNVTVVNVPSYCEDEVAVHTLALLFSSLRKVPLYDRSIKQETWDWTNGKPIPRMEDRTWGFVGFGKIPQRISQYISGFNLDTIAYDPYQSEDELHEYGVQKVTFETLLENSDFVSVHAPLTIETKNLFSTGEFERMKESSIIVNTARGGLIDVSALDKAIESGEVAGAGLDVMPNEPPERFDLLKYDEVVATPHVAWYSSESNDELRRTLTEDLVGVLEGEPPMNPVN